MRLFRHHLFSRTRVFLIKFKSYKYLGKRKKLLIYWVNVTAKKGKRKEFNQIQCSFAILLLSWLNSLAVIALVLIEGEGFTHFIITDSFECQLLKNVIYFAEHNARASFFIKFPIVKLLGCIQWIYISSDLNALLLCALFHEFYRKNEFGNNAKFLWIFAILTNFSRFWQRCRRSQSPIVTHRECDSSTGFHLVLSR